MMAARKVHESDRWSAGLLDPIDPIDPIDAPTMTHGMRAGAATHPGARITFVGAAGEQSFALAELHAAGRRAAGGLALLGLRPGDVVAMQLPNWPEAIVAYVAAAELGVTIAPIVHVYGVAEVSFILESSRARAFVVAATWRGSDLLASVRAGRRPASLEHVIVVRGAASAGDVAWDSVLESPPLESAHATAADDRALLLYTSGTTGRPKGVIHTHASIAAEIAQMVRHNDADDDSEVDSEVEGVVEGDARREATLVSFPIGHMAGVLGAARSFYRDGHTIFMEAWDATAAAQLIDQHHVTRTAGTPLHLLSLFEAADRDLRSLASLRSFLLGATTVSPSVIAAADARGVRAFRCYGSTEQPTVSCGRPTDDVDDRARTDGQVLPGVEVRIVDADGAEVAPGVAGEIQTRGVDLMAGYADPSDDVAALTADGWYRSGDIGTLDGRGFLTITDRLKDVIIRGGENIASKEVEDALLTHPGVRDVAVVGVPDERFGERVCAIVVGSADSLSVEALRAHVIAAGLARQKAPESLVVVDELRRTASGKIQKHLLREALADGSLIGCGRARV